MPIYNTVIENDNGSEIDVRVHYDYQPEEGPEYDHDKLYLVYPGCPQEVTIHNVEFHEYTMDKYGTIEKAWVDAWDESLDHHDKWEEDILESINQDKGV